MTKTPALHLAALVVIVALLALIPLMGRAQSFTADLDIGSTGTDVTILQSYLAGDPTLYPEGLVTGYYGPLTAAAVTRFQARYGIDQVGRVGPITRAQLNELLGTGGPPDSSEPGAAPVMSDETVVVTSTSAQIRWITNEPARHRVMYGVVWPFLYVSAPSVVGASVGGSADVTLTGLTPNTLYFYIRESMDAEGNIMWTSVENFRTNP